MNTRNAVRNLTPQQITDLRYAYRNMMQIRDTRGYRFHAGHHGLPRFRCIHGERSQGGDPNVRLFLPWHRAYVYNFELAVQDAGENSELSVPWWDWTSDKSRREGIPTTFSEERLPDGDRNPLNSFRIISTENETPFPLEEDTVRDPGSPGSLPLPSTVENLLNLNDYGDFSDQLEQVHNFIHVWVGGHMAQVPFAAFDPVFWSHHSMVDRIWWLWQLRHGNSGMPEHTLDMVLAPFNLRVRDVLNIYQLGYDYAGIEVSVPF